MQGHSHSQPERRHQKEHDGCEPRRGARNEGRVLLVDTDPQGDLTTSLGLRGHDELDITFATHLEVYDMSKKGLWLKVI